MADVSITNVLMKFQSKESTPGGSKQGNIGVKWIFKTKQKENGEVDKYKARLVAKGYKQQYGVDYIEVFSPVARHDTIRLVVSLAAQNAWPLLGCKIKKW